MLWAHRHSRADHVSAKQPVCVALSMVLLAAQIPTAKCLQSGNTNEGMHGNDTVSALSIDVLAMSPQSLRLETRRSASQVMYDMHSDFRTAVAEQLLLARSDSGVHGAKLIIGASIVTSILLFAGSLAAYFMLLRGRPPSATMLCSSCMHVEAQTSGNSQSGTTEANVAANQEKDGSKSFTQPKDGASEGGPPLRKVLFYVIGH